jgi:hypothetical protein
MWFAVFGTVGALLAVGRHWAIRKLGEAKHWDGE